MDIAAYHRLVGSIDAALDALPEKNEHRSADALAEAYNTSYAAARKLIPPDDIEEFDEQFSPYKQAIRSQPEAVEQARTIRMRLARLSGWLRGYINTAQAQLNAEAYAREKVQAENREGVGFSS